MFLIFKNTVKVSIVAVGPFFLCFISASFLQVESVYAYILAFCLAVSICAQSILSATSTCFSHCQELYPKS